MRSTARRRSCSALNGAIACSCAGRTNCFVLFFLLGSGWEMGQESRPMDKTLAPESLTSSTLVPNWSCVMHSPTSSSPSAQCLSSCFPGGQGALIAFHILLSSSPPWPHPLITTTGLLHPPQLLLLLGWDSPWADSPSRFATCCLVCVCENPVHLENICDFWPSQFDVFSWFLLLPDPQDFLLVLPPCRALSWAQSVFNHYAY